MINAAATIALLSVFAMFGLWQLTTAVSEAAAAFRQNDDGVFLPLLGALSEAIPGLLFLILPLVAASALVGEIGFIVELIITGILTGLIVFFGPGLRRLYGAQTITNLLFGVMAVASGIGIGVILLIEGVTGVGIAVIALGAAIGLFVMRNPLQQITNT